MGTRRLALPTNSLSNGGSPRSELRNALSACRSAFFGIGLFGAIINILMLTGAIFMLQVYDRVLPSHSVPTLVALAVLAGGLFVMQGLLDLIRGRLLSRIGVSLDEALSIQVYHAIVRLPLKTGNHSGGTQPLRDLDTIRAFLSGLGPTALFDMPWMLLFLSILFAFHPLIGVTALTGGILLVALTILTEFLTRGSIKEATLHDMLRQTIAQASLRNAEALTAMGMAGQMGNIWGGVNKNYIASQRRVTDISGGIGSISRVLRLMLQSAVLGLGAYLVINQEATAGIIIAAAILTARALAPVDLAIGNWKGFVAARQSWRRLTELLAALPQQGTRIALPAPKNSISVRNISAVPPGSTRIVARDVSFTLTGGQGLGVIGPSGSGKSSLARMLVGSWNPLRGEIRIDGATLGQWAPEDLGRHIGYLPQDVELFAGTVAQNIARFDSDCNGDDIFTAAKAAGAHDLILNLPNGYETQIGEHGACLSAGQRQRVALARALYRDPFLVVLDEPNANLDSEGEEALTVAIQKIRNRGGIVVVIAHRANAVAAVDALLVMNQGRQQAFGPKDEVLSKMIRPASRPRAFKVVPEAERTCP